MNQTTLKNNSARGDCQFVDAYRSKSIIVLNNLAGLAWTERRIALCSDGTPWRPLIDTRDISRTYAGSAVGAVGVADLGISNLDPAPVALEHAAAKFGNGVYLNNFDNGDTARWSGTS